MLAALGFLLPWFSTLSSSQNSNQFLSQYFQVKLIYAKYTQRGTSRPRWSLLKDLPMWEEHVGKQLICLVNDSFTNYYSVRQQEMVLALKRNSKKSELCSRISATSQKALRGKSEVCGNRDGFTELSRQWGLQDPGDERTDWIGLPSWTDNS